MESDETEVLKFKLNSCRYQGKTAGADQYVLGKENKNKKTYHFYGRVQGSRVPIIMQYRKQTSSD